MKTMSKIKEGKINILALFTYECPTATYQLSNGKLKRIIDCRCGQCVHGRMLTDDAKDLLTLFRLASKDGQ